MVVKSKIGEEQKQPLPHAQAKASQQQRHRSERRAPVIIVRDESGSRTCSRGSSSCNNDVVVVNGNNKNIPRLANTKQQQRKRTEGLQSGRGTTAAFILFLVISLLSESVLGRSLNSTLEGDPLINMNDDDGDGGGGASTRPSAIIANNSSTSTSASRRIVVDNAAEAAARARNQSNHNDNSSSTSTSTSTTTTVSLPPEDDLRDKHRKIIAASSEHGNDHVNLTMPIHPDHLGNSFYVVINNGTLSGSFATFPIIAASPAISSSIMNLKQGFNFFQNLTATVLGLRVEQTSKGVSYDNSASKILANSPAVIRFFGIGFTNYTVIRFVTEAGDRGVDCDDMESTKTFHFDKGDLTEHSAKVKVTIPPLNDDDHLYYVCVREENIADMPWIHQGREQWIALTSYQKWLPVWAHIVLLLLLLSLSGLFSGLNLGLMAIDRTELRIIINAGSEQERRYAKQIQPVRDNGNYLLCSLLLGNVLVNATLTILLDDLTSGLIAVVGSTVAIVIFGEIVPQAVCSRHGLAVGAKTVWITKLFMAITFPLSYPISVILNKVLGEELGNVYNRDRLKELVRVTQGVNDLETDEVNIIAGALELKQKTVMDVMTKLEDVYMLPIDAILDFDTVSEIMSNGYSRIPVFESSRGNVVSLLYAKDLAFVDPDDKMPLRAICEFYSNPCHFVFENVTLNVLFNVFKQGDKGHMAFVQRIRASDKSDPTYEVVGLVTLEDVIEELIQEEINDETDVLQAENKRRAKGGDYNAITALAMNGLKTEGTTVSPQLTLAAFQYLSSAVEEFNDLRISKSVLERLLKQNIYFHIKIKNKENSKTDDPSSTILYERGKPADFFIMILEGRAIAEIGKESLVFESGPFTFFGTKSLSQISDVPSTPGTLRKISQTSFSETAVGAAGAAFTFIPDYTVRAITDLTYFQISRSMYQAARQATLLEKSYSVNDEAMCDEKTDEQLQNHLDEVELNNAENKAKDKSLTLGKPTGRGSISEKRLQGVLEDRNWRRRPPPAPTATLSQMSEEEAVIGDNNNICLNLAKSEDPKEELNLANNMSRVILCPKDERPHPDLRQEARFLVEGDDKYFCKL